MAGTGDGERLARTDDDGAAAAASGAAEQRVSYLDQALWKNLAAAGSPEAIAGFWLTLQCRMIPRASRGVVVLADPAGESFVPAAVWPEAPMQDHQDIARAAERALRERRGVILGHKPSAPQLNRRCTAAYPFTVDDTAIGAVAIELADRGERQLREVMRQLQWGASWIELALRRRREQEAGRSLGRASAVLDLAAAALGQRKFAAACNVTVTELAIRLDCDLVGIGFAKGENAKVAALSHSAQFGKRMNLVAGFAAAMDEAIDQAATVLYPPVPGGGYRITHAHSELARRLDGATVLSVPLHSHDAFVGAISFQRGPDRPFDQETVDLCDAAAAVLAPILEEKRRNDRLILVKLWESARTQIVRFVGPGHFGRKLAVAGLAVLVGLAATVTAPYRVTSPTQVEGQIQRVIVAPFDGYVASQSVRAGETVRAGTVLATLDDRDITLDRVHWVMTMRQHQMEYDQALAKKSRADINISKAQIAQAEAQIALDDEQLKRTRLVAPYDGLVVSGDLSQKVGAAVKRGEELFRIAPLNSYRLIIKVDDADIADVVPGATGTVKVSALIDDALPYRIERITPVTEASDGRNHFRVEAALERTDGRLRPGMEGFAKTDVEDRLLVRIWTQDLLRWIRLKTWVWWP